MRQGRELGEEFPVRPVASAEFCRPWVSDYGGSFDFGFFLPPFQKATHRPCVEHLIYFRLSFGTRSMTCTFNLACGSWYEVDGLLSVPGLARLATSAATAAHERFE